MRIPRKEVEYIAELARLRLNEEEIELFSEQLGKIIEYINKLNEVDTSGVDPTSHVVPLKNVFREDEPLGSPPVDETMANAPDRYKNYYRVPRILG